MPEVWKPLVLTVAPNGAYKTKQDHAGVPLSPAELAEVAAQCLDAGAAMIHLHVRDAAGRHSLDPALYDEAIRAVRNAVGERIVIQITSEAGKRYEPAYQMAAIRQTRPEAVSLAVRELAPDAASEVDAADFFHWVAQEHIVPQYILYDDQDVERYQDLLARDVIPAVPHWLLFVLGRYTKNQESSPDALLPFLAVHDHRTPWAVCAFGAREHACGVCAATFGGHVRVGFENNLYLLDGSTAAGNADLVSQMAGVVDALGRPLADADQLRAMFHSD